MCKKLRNIIFTIAGAFIALGISGSIIACFVLPFAADVPGGHIGLPLMGLVLCVSVAVLWRIARTKYTRSRLTDTLLGMDGFLRVPVSDIRRFRIRRRIATLFFFTAITPTLCAAVALSGLLSWWIPPVMLFLIGETGHVFLTTPRRFLSDRLYWICPGCRQGYQTPFPLLWDLREGSFAYALCPGCRSKTRIEIAPAHDGPPAWERKEAA